MNFWGRQGALDSEITCYLLEFNKERIDNVIELLNDLSRNNQNKTTIKTKLQPKQNYNLNKLTTKTKQHSNRNSKNLYDKDETTSKTKQLQQKYKYNKKGTQ